MTDDQLLRAKALEIAAGQRAGAGVPDLRPSSEVVRNAQAYYEFLKPARDEAQSPATDG